MIPDTLTKNSRVILDRAETSGVTTDDDDGTLAFLTCAQEVPGESPVSLVRSKFVSRAVGFHYAMWSDESPRRVTRKVRFMLFAGQSRPDRAVCQNWKTVSRRRMNKPLREKLDAFPRQILHAFGLLYLRKEKEILLGLTGSHLRLCLSVSRRQAITFVSR